MTRYYSFVPNEMLFLYTGEAAEDPGKLGELINQFQNLFLEILMSKRKVLTELVRRPFKSPKFPSGQQQQQTKIMLEALDFLDELHAEGKLEGGLFGSLDSSFENKDQLAKNVVWFASEQIYNLERSVAIVSPQFHADVVDYINESQWKSNDFVIFGLSLIIHRLLELSNSEILELAPDLEEIDELPVAVTPNWLLAASDDTGYDQGTGGGPGTKPVPAKIRDYLTGVKPLAALQFGDSDAPWNFHVRQTENTNDRRLITDALRTALDKREQSKPAVNVIVLDTAPPAITTERDRRCVRSLQNAYARWHDKHPLLRSLLAPGRPHITTVPVPSRYPNAERVDRAEYDKLTIWYEGEYTYEDDPPPIGYNPDDYDPKRICKSVSDQNGYTYQHRVMDHGTFVSGIIHTICPTAHIHLVQVLNDFGHGNLMVLARQLHRILSELKDDSRPIVVNMSLVFDIPVENAHLLSSKRGNRAPDRPDDAIQRRQAIEAVLVGDKALRESMVTVLRFLTESVVYTDSDQSTEDPEFKGRGRIVAAAGNDWTPSNKEQPQARYPAAFNNVIGVASLNHDLIHPASYSNKADDPEQWGIRTIGGNQSADAGWSDPETGILGLYIGDFPAKFSYYDETIQAKMANDPRLTLPNEHGWARWSGTSFAAPIVTGLIAQLLCANDSSDLSWAVKVIRDSFISDAGLPDILPIRQNAQTP